MDVAFTVVERVEELEQTDQHDLPLFHEAIDVNALELAAESAEGPFKATFAYGDYIVTITGDDDVKIRPATHNER